MHTHRTKLFTASLMLHPETKTSSLEMSGSNMDLPIRCDFDGMLAIGFEPR